MNLVKNHPPKNNIDFYMTVSDHLSQFERCMKSLLKVKDLQETIQEIYFLIHQAYIELDKEDIQSVMVKITLENEVFEDYLQSQILENVPMVQSIFLPQSLPQSTHQNSAQNLL